MPTPEQMRTWLPMYLGDAAAAAYQQTPLPLLMELFPDVRYGPHTVEMFTFFKVLNSRIAQRSEPLILMEGYERDLDTDLMFTYNEHAGAGFTNHRHYFGMSDDETAPYVDQIMLRKLTPGEFQDKTVSLRMADLLPDLPTFGMSVTTHNCYQIIFNMILLQNWYAPYAHTHTRLQKLVPAHNGFCDRWGLPRLSLLADFAPPAQGALV